ncbi:MAG: SNF2-related protein, partial [Verrucomicrobiota bacterium]
MPLTIADFEGFDLASAREYLESFDAETTRKGEEYFAVGAVKGLRCLTPGRKYLANVHGNFKYQVQLENDDGWDGECSCPIGYECKHIYAAVKQLLAAQVGQGTAGAGSPPAEDPPSGLAATVREKLGRDLTDHERRYLQNISRLFRKASNGGLQYQHELTGLGQPSSLDYWNRLELYPRVPRSEVDFWNYLALYLQEKTRWPIPDFMRPATDLEKARAGMQKHFRAQEIQRWSSALEQLRDPFYAAASGNRPVEAPAKPVELRVCCLPKELLFEWRLAGDREWAAIKPRKAVDFEARYASGLPPEAALIWLSFLQRAQFRSGDFSYSDPWVSEQLGRWLRQPLLRPLLVGDSGEPLVFHDQPLRWAVTEPGDPDGDYSFSLVQADGQPAPPPRLAIPGNPAIYLTAAGVFQGPPFESSVMDRQGATLIPAKAFESAAGLRLLDRLQAAPPPRLAARLRTVKLRPGLHAEVKAPWPGQITENCYLDVYGASDDGEHFERWTDAGWSPEGNAAGQRKKDAFVQIDRSDLGALIPPLDQSGFKWDYNQQRWQLRVSKKFPAAFVAFLKALPAATRINLGGELASFQDAAVAGTIRLEATEAETDWFDLRVVVNVSDTTLTNEEIKLLLDAKGNWVRLDKKGWRKLEFALSEQEDQELARLGLTPHDLTSEPQRLHAFQLADRAARKFLPAETCERIERRAAELQARVTPPVPDAIRAELRPYQRDGFHFLAYLSANRFGGILADDMGLGKTLQTLAWLAWLRNQVAAGSSPSKSAGATANPSASNGETAPAILPSLVVCPKSVTDNWQAEAVKFFPDLKVRIWTAGDVQAMATELASAHLHVLNYSQLRLVGPALARQNFCAVVLDEGQFIKNPTSQTAQVARKLRSQHRLILTGTPIENRLLDLWSLMSFAMPGALGSRAEFGRIYDAKNDPLARQRLSARVRPFLIRRTKAQVARDLPDRVEEDLFCELEGEQKALYRAELKRAQAMLLGVNSAAALNKQRFNFLTSLLRLRQICCHPKLVKPDSKAASAKVEALIETLEPVLEEGEKVLVFSQFVELLDLLRAEAKKRDWPHWY